MNHIEIITLARAARYDKDDDVLRNLLASEAVSCIGFCASNKLKLET